MEANGNAGGHLERKTSQNSSRSGHSGTVRAKSRRVTPKSSSTETSDKSLISFPSLSPAASPTSSRHDALNSLLSSQQVSQSPTPRRTPSAPSIVDGLTAPSPALGARPLFDDSPMNSHIPGAIHHASDEHIERLLARTGAVALVRQLARDLAQRDAQMVAVRRRAEERERLLKRMLLECQVSNLDIETRLRNLEVTVDAAGGDGVVGRNGVNGRGADSPKGMNNDINEMVNQAMRDTVGSESGDMDDGYLGLGSADGQDINATIRPGRTFASLDDETRSVESVGVRDKKWKGTKRGWKEYLWGKGATRSVSGGSSITSDAGDDAEVAPRSRAVSGPGPQRRPLQSDLFQPPEYTSNSNGSRSASRQAPALPQDGDNSDSYSQKSSVSVASWALKLVAGTSQTVRDDGQRTSRGRAIISGSGTPKDPETASLASTKAPKSNVIGATKLSNEVVSSHGARRSAASLSMGSAQTTVLRANSAGPVEMDTILPPDSRPPTLLQTYSNYHPTDFLTDRFGFIYDQRRRRQQKEASDRAQNISRVGSKTEMLGGVSVVVSDGEDDDTLGSPGSGSRPETPCSTDDHGPKTVKRWHDFLKTPTSPTELLSHTPASGALSSVEQDSDEAPKAPQITIEPRGSLPSASANPQPLAVPVVSDNATLARPSISSGTSTPANAVKDQNEPVKLLLEQLTELHDSLQRDKTVRWNEFLRKVRAERRREREAAAAAAGEGRPGLTSMPEVSLADGEMIGVAGLGNKGKVGRAKWKEFKQLVLGGIPVAHRAKVWAECSGASVLRVPGYYDELVNNGVEDPLVVSQIAMDINRTLTDNIFFRKGPGVAKLEEVLLAYSRRNPEIGYCQGMNLIAASLLLIMPTAEDAFWVMTSMIENILPPNYYDHSLLGSRADQRVLRQYVTEILPKLSAHLDDLGIELEALTFQWFLSVFTDCLSAEALFRVWDVVLCTNDGSTFLFQLALALLKLNEKQLLKCSTPAGVYSYINHHMTNHAISIDGLIQASEALKKVVRREDVEARRKSALEREMEIVSQRNKRILERVVEQRAEACSPEGDQCDETADGKASSGLQAQPPAPINENTAPGNMEEEHITR